MPMRTRHWHWSLMGLSLNVPLAVMETNMRVFTARFLLPPVPSPAVQSGGGGGGRPRLSWSSFWVYFPLIAAVCVENLIWWFMETDQAWVGLLGSLQGPSGQISSPIKHQKQSGINPPRGLLVCSRCVANMPLLCPNEHDSTSMDTQLKIRKHNKTGKMKLLLIWHSHFL